MQTLEARCSVICTRPVVSKRLCQVLKPGQFFALARPFLVNLSPQALSFFLSQGKYSWKSFLWSQMMRLWGEFSLRFYPGKALKLMNIQAPSERYKTFEYNVPSSTISKWMHTVNPSLLLYCSQWIIRVSSLSPEPDHSASLSRPASWC